jgi:hypothetical protein
MMKQFFKRYFNRYYLAALLRKWADRLDPQSTVFREIPLPFAPNSTEVETPKVVAPRKVEELPTVWKHALPVDDDVPRPLKDEIPLPYSS